MTHYLIDGYNWLFRSPHSHEKDLKFEREKIIQELSHKLSSAGIQATLVFDSHFQPGPAEKLHSKGIAIYFTNEGQTADDYILEFIKHAARPQDYTIVTSDNRLAWAARQRAGHSLPIPEFKNRLERIYLKKSRSKIIQEKPFIHTIAPIPKKTLQDRYEEIFEERLESPKQKKILEKIKKPLDQTSLMSDYERWKRIFEEGENGA